MSDLKNRLESILFSAGKQLTFEELSRLTKERDPEKIKQALVELREDLEKKESSIMLIIEGDSCKLTVREKYLPFVRKVVSKTELPKSIIETLAIVAFKAPVLQSKVIHIRTNKAYKHLEFLEEKGYITREKKGRTKLIKLTQKFFEYFDVPPDKLKEKFKGFEELDTAIDKMEKLEPEGSKSSEQDVLREPKEVDLVDEEGHKVKLKEYDTEPETEPYKETPSPTEPYVEKVDGLETYGEKKKRKKRKHKKKHKKKEEKEEKKEKKGKKEEKPEETEKEAPEEEVEIAEEDLAAALTGEEPEKAEEEAEKVEKAAEKVAEKAKEAEEEIKKATKKPGEKEKKEPKEEPRKKITAEDIKKQAKQAAEKTETKEHESEGIFQGEIPKELEQKISQRAEEIVYGKKPEVENKEKTELSFKKKPELAAEKKLEFPKAPPALKTSKPKKKKNKKQKEKTILE